MENDEEEITEKTLLKEEQRGLSFWYKKPFCRNTKREPTNREGKGGPRGGPSLPPQKKSPEEWEKGEEEEDPEHVFEMLEDQEEQEESREDQGQQGHQQVGGSTAAPGVGERVWHQFHHQVVYDGIAAPQERAQVKNKDAPMTPP